jgi:hypothetical protein
MFRGIRGLSWFWRLGFSGGMFVFVAVVLWKEKRMIAQVFVHFLVH